ncbi:MAG: Hint domain-containing protein [Marinosulfonomonas sp.]
MPTTYYDQFYTLDPGNPPSGGTVLTKSYLEIIDQDSNDLINRFSNDMVNGQDVTNAWPGDVITVVMDGVTVSITGTTFYLASGPAVFTPTDGTVLSNSATFVSSTYVTTGGSLDVGELGPPCFTAGTMILTDRGEIAVEELRVGDRVKTLDHGFQAIRWIGKSDTDASGDFAPIVFKPGALGNDREMRVSPQHRVLVQGWQAELFFGQSEILVPAKHLVDDDLICREPGDRVAYYHVMFDQHEVVFSDGIATESFFPGDQILLQDRAVRAELVALFPELETANCPGFETTARSTVKRGEAMVLSRAA